ncbi:MAG: M50 family metallopeptidase [Candidatus Hodarchaeota archaeon]
MHFYWAIIAPILQVLAIFFSAVLIKERNRIRLLFLGIICVFNLNIAFNIINTFRRDYNGDISLFPLINYIAYLIIVNAVFISLSFFLLIKLEAFKENSFIRSVQTFFYKARDNIFIYDKNTDILLSIFLLFCLFYIVGFLNLYIHEFGHAMADIFVGTYYQEIRINIYLQGWTSGGGIPADKLFYPKRTVILLGGLIIECIFALFLLIIILRKKVKSNFTWLLSIAISMLFLNRVALYFTFPQLVNIRSDSLALVNIGYDPWILFFIFFPFLIITFIFTFKLISRFYKTSVKNNKKFLCVYFLGLTTYIVVLNILKLIDKSGIPLISLSFY